MHKLAFFPFGGILDFNQHIPCFDSTVQPMHALIESPVGSEFHGLNKVRLIIRGGGKKKIKRGSSLTCFTAETCVCGFERLPKVRIPAQAHANYWIAHRRWRCYDKAEKQNKHSGRSNWATATKNGKIQILLAVTSRQVKSRCWVLLLGEFTCGSCFTF